MSLKYEPSSEPLTLNALQPIRDELVKPGSQEARWLLIGTRNPES
jgi:hypothetical protein